MPACLLSISPYIGPLSKPALQLSPCFLLKTQHIATTPVLHMLCLKSPGEAPKGRGGFIIGTEGGVAVIPFGQRSGFYLSPDQLVTLPHPASGRGGCLCGHVMSTEQKWQWVTAGMLSSGMSSCPLWDNQLQDDQVLCAEGGGHQGRGDHPMVLQTQWLTPLWASG